MTGQLSRREVERKRLLDLVARRPERNAVKGYGVVLGDGIRGYCKQFGLITPYNEENLKPANYKLTVGDEYAIGGEIRTLLDESGKNQIIIPPFEVAVIKTNETINMPRFLIARWNIQVKRAYQGLLWVGGPQVDAGYVGHLFCPIYNLSDKEVSLLLGEAFAVIDFVTTTDFSEEESPKYLPMPPERILLEDYQAQELKSALVTLVTKKLTGFQLQVKQLEERTNQFIAVGLALIGILFAVLALFVTVGDPKAMPFWAFFSVTFSFLAFLIAVGSMKKLY